VHQTARVLARWDPLDLVEAGAPADEYAAEALTKGRARLAPS
jgi:hypothetical protein